MKVDKKAYWYIFGVHIAVGCFCGYFAIVENFWLTLCTGIIFFSMSLFLKASDITKFSKRSKQ